MLGISYALPPAPSNPVVVPEHIYSCNGAQFPIEILKFVLNFKKIKNRVLNFLKDIDLKESISQQQRVTS